MPGYRRRAFWVEVLEMVMQKGRKGKPRFSSHEPLNRWGCRFRNQRNLPMGTQQLTGRARAWTHVLISAALLSLLNSTLLSWLASWSAVYALINPFFPWSLSPSQRIMFLHTPPIWNFNGSTTSYLELRLSGGLPLPLYIRRVMLMHLVQDLLCLYNKPCSSKALSYRSQCLHRMQEYESDSTCPSNQSPALIGSQVPYLCLYLPISIFPLLLLKPLPQVLLKTSRVSHSIWAIPCATVFPATLLDTVLLFWLPLTSEGMANHCLYSVWQSVRGAHVLWAPTCEVLADFSPLRDQIRIRR